MNDSTSDVQNMPHETENSEAAMLQKKSAARKTSRKKAVPADGAVEAVAAHAALTKESVEPEPAAVLSVPLKSAEVAFQVAESPVMEDHSETGTRPPANPRHAGGAGRGKRSPPSAAGG